MHYIMLKNNYTCHSSRLRLLSLYSGFFLYKLDYPLSSTSTLVCIITINQHLVCNKFVVKLVIHITFALKKKVTNMKIVTSLIIVVVPKPTIACVYKIHHASWKRNLFIQLMYYYSFFLHKSKFHVITYRLNSFLCEKRA